MAIILSIETSTTNCSVSLSSKGETLVLKEDNNSNYSHAESLHVFINEVVKSAKINRENIDAIAVSKGPGSYTGLRIGVSAAKGLSYALGIPLISVSTLKALAYQINVSEGVIVPILDARRLEVYSAVYNSSFKQVRTIEAQILNEHSFHDYLANGKVFFVGNAVEKTKTLISHDNAIFVDGKLPSAKEMSVLAYNKYKISDTEDVAYFEPFYLKDFIALKSKK
ncbi:tRNA (adenosine(37)-N6)-threonylcarbamoyltransferase complex dimerization subunit type 1 TsaB [uncultured Psychroserpens sp.]|uniref:tRNA (adenosine(37)-N6)-threonylcarbamoyltransferase complex dimerization subunit type 1 TsaB n=1 Tax=uncultured Psychroserpens sp. TaxID=255436 RepID=UPI00260D5873|nr:tRNA (adenosine(37)-N6)-threonylcarbamoyltransferase complex dimerization subunit type 1 TsaB [uncultured Psychroserpens sp.]